MIQSVLTSLHLLVAPSLFVQLFPLSHISACVETHDDVLFYNTLHFVHFAIMGVGNVL